MSNNGHLDDVDLTEKLLPEFKALTELLEESNKQSMKADTVHVSPPCQAFRKSKRVVSDDEESVDSGVVWLTKTEPITKPVRSLGGCLCKCMLITTLVLAAITLITSAFAYFWVKDVVEHLTIRGNHRSFPIVDMSDVERDLLKDRVKLFVDELRRGKSGRPLDDLVITQDEVNGLLCGSDYLRGNMQVTLEENNIKEEYSLPMDMFPGGSGRYFDGHDFTKIMPKEQRVELKMETKALHKDWFVGPLYFLQLSYKVEDSNTYHQQLLELFLENGSIFGNAIPDDVIQDHQNIMDGFYSDPDSGFDVRSVVEGIQGVKIEDGKLTIMPRRRHHDEGDEPAVLPRYEPALFETTQQEPEPITVELRSEVVEGAVDEDDMVQLEVVSEDDTWSQGEIDIVEMHGDDAVEMDEEEAADYADNEEATSEETYLRSNKVPVASPKAPVAATSNLRTTKSNP